jgi:ABC-type amino acid transport substrate-binding protein
LESGCFYLHDLVSSYDFRRDIGAIKVFNGWLRENPGTRAALLLIIFVVLLGSVLVKTKMDRFLDLRVELSADSAHYKTRLEQTKQRLAAVLSHLEANPLVTAPGNHQSLIGPYAKMEWKYGTTENGQNLSSHKDSILKIQKANIILEKGDPVAGEAAIEWQDNTSGDGIRQYSSKHSIIEIKNAAAPLNRDKAIKAMVAGQAAWYPIALSDKLGDGGTFLWRVIEGEMDSSGQLRVEGSWGPYSVFTIYPSVTKRIEVTKKIRIGSYNVGQVELEGKSSNSKDATTEKAREGLSCVKPSDGLSDGDTTVLCSVIDQVFKKDKYGTIDPVMARYSNIDDRLLRALKTGELDIALGNISSARYRREKGINFVEYAEPKPVLVTKDQERRNEDKIGAEDIICVVRGTVYKHVLEELIKKNQGRYNFAVCQNTFDAVDKLFKNDIQWFLMMGEQSWKDIEKLGLYRNEKEMGLLKSVPKENGIEGDSFAMTDDSIFEEMCSVMKEMKGKLINNKVILEHVECLPRLR